MVPEDDKKVFIEIGKRVKSLRESKGLSLRQLAAICDVDHAKIHALEAGKLNFTFSTLIKIAKGLETQVGDFIKS
ncbi:helix-turn-helix domain-containing protein [Chitinophaga sp. 22321]|uniref:Helix-turn-helix transcriptional regulator n=1 Tax=Chitinophaga hostae TaxID=2831022 RepID=A0ABS5J322_9BACT|nr:helix-turn-helix transcriptional regulator [Chitinophaga hostae]MBS0029473.1 helix-turn-helix transcriptional regulator [Chitinophaga hostae]